MVEEIVFRDRSGIFDNPQPPVPDGVAVILWQRGQALVGQWDAEVCGFVHPSNQMELESEAREAILAEYPDADLASDEIRVFSCPEQIRARFAWNWRRL